MLENGKVKMKIGNGVTAWSALPYFGGAENQIYVGELNEGETQAAAIERLVGANEKNLGDIAIIKALINGTKYEYTAYVYNGSAWAAMDGNYNAENVYFAQDLVYTAAIGAIAAPTGGSGTINAAGKNVKDVLASILAKEQNPKTTQPSVSVSLTGAGEKEVGTEFTPSYSASLNAGSYTYGPATGIVATSWTVSDSNGGSGATASGSFDKFTVGDATNYKVTAVAAYGDGAIPVTNLGNAYAAGQIKAGSRTSNSIAVTGYRKMFAGSKTTQDATITSAIVRAAAESMKADNKTDWSIPVVADALQVIIAVPTGYKVTKVADVGAFGTDIFGSFVKQTVAVEGANGYTAKDYNVYVYKPSAKLGANTYQVTVVAG